MSFKYINPGYSGFLKKYDASTMADVTPTEEQSRTGSAFFNSESRNYLITNLPTGRREFWFKFDFFFSDSYLFLFVGNGDREGNAYYHYSLSIGEYVTNSTISFRLAHRNTTNTITVEADCLRRNALNSLWGHFLITGDSDAYAEFKINNKYYGKYSSQESSISSSSNFIICGYGSSNTPVYFSNIIISDEYISPNEKIVALPISNTVTDFDELPSGLYRADTVGDTLLQSVNVNSLVEQYGSDTNVTGIALIGNPAYEVDDVIGSLTALTTKNNVVTEHDKISLSTDTDAMICSSFAVDSSTTINDLANMQFGWRAEE